MNICYLVDDTIYREAGVQYGILNAAQKIVEKKEHKVTILFTDTKNVPKKAIPGVNLVPIAQGIDIPKLDLNGSNSTFPGFADMQKVREYFHNNKVDVLHTFYPFSPFISGKILKYVKRTYPKIKTICSFQIHVEERPLPRFLSKAFGKYMKKYVKYVDLFVHNAKATYLYGKKYLGVDSEFLTFGFANYELSNRQLSTKKKSFDIFFIGRLEKRKGVIELIKSIQLIDDEDIIRNLKVHIAGSGPQEDEAKEEIDKEYKDVFKFYGRVTDKQRDELYAFADISIFPALYGEAMGNVIIEGMNFGAVPIGYANFGYKDTLKDFAKDLLVPVGRQDLLKKKIIHFYKHREDLEKYRKKLKDLFKQVYWDEVMYKKMIDLYS